MPGVYCHTHATAMLQRRLYLVAYVVAKTGFLLAVLATSSAGERALFQSNVTSMLVLAAILLEGKLDDYVAQSTGGASASLHVIEQAGVGLAFQGLQRHAPHCTAAPSVEVLCLGMHVVLGCVWLYSKSALPLAPAAFGLSLFTARIMCPEPDTPARAMGGAVAIAVATCAAVLRGAALERLDAARACTVLFLVHVLYAPLYIALCGGVYALSCVYGARGGGGAALSVGSRELAAKLEQMEAQLSAAGGREGSKRKLGLFH